MVATTEAEVAKVAEQKVMFRVGSENRKKVGDEVGRKEEKVEIVVNKDAQCQFTGRKSKECEEVSLVLSSHSTAFLYLCSSSSNSSNNSIAVVLLWW